MIEVIQAGRVERCQERNADGLQCDHFAEHFGSHQHALSESECLRWPSQDDIEDAAATAQIEAMTDEEVEASLLDEEAGIDRDMIRNWSRGAGVFAKAMIKANATLAEQKSEIERLTKQNLLLSQLAVADHDARMKRLDDLIKVEAERDELQLRVDCCNDACGPAFDEIAAMCGVAEWEYPGQVIRDVKLVVEQRDAAFERGRAVGIDVGMRTAESEAIKELAALRALINSPQTENFLEAVRNEAAHQVERWGVAHDAGKRPEDWITLFIYLLGKAAKAHYDGSRDKLLHHIITAAAVALNWHRHATGEDTRMRPGIEPLAKHLEEPSKLTDQFIDETFAKARDVIEEVRAPFKPGVKL